MSTWPAHVEPIDRAILDLLCSVAAKWIEHDHDQLTSTEQEALRLMRRAGLIELRVRFEVTNTKLNQVAQIIAKLTGNFTQDSFLADVFQWLPDWLDKDMGLRGAVRCVPVRIEQIRLTDQGELARHDYENQTPEQPSMVVSFVRKLGFFSRQKDAPGKIIIEKCTVEELNTVASGSSESTTQHIAAAQASASASIGDVYVNHHTQIKNDFGELASLLQKAFDQGKAAVPQNADETSVTKQAKSKTTGKKKRGMSAKEAEAKAAAILARDGWPGDLRSLAKLVGCSHETLRKCKSVKPYLKSTKSPVVELNKNAMDQLIDDELDPSEALAYEEEFEIIYKKAGPSEQKKLDDLTPAQRRSLVDARRQQVNDENEDSRPLYAKRRRKV